MGDSGWGNVAASWLSTSGTGARLGFFHSPWSKKQTNKQKNAKKKKEEEEEAKLPVLTILHNRAAAHKQCAHQSDTQ